MKRALFTTLACSTLLSLTAAAPSATAPVREATQCVSVAPVSGTIMNVDMEGHSFTLVAEEKEVTVSFDANTVFLLGDKQVDAARLLKLGTKVTVSREGDLAKKVQASIEDPQ